MGLWNKRGIWKNGILHLALLKKLDTMLKVSIKTQAYLHTNILLNIKSIGGKHSASEKINDVDGNRPCAGGNKLKK